MSIILNCDSYKASHYLQYPPKTTSMFSYLESRGGRYPSTVFFGLQQILKEYLTTPVTLDDVFEADELFLKHGVPFNKMGWARIARDLNGKLPGSKKKLRDGVST